MLSYNLNLWNPTYLAFLVFTILTSSYTKAQCEHPDLESLVALYNTLDGPNWQLKGGWNNVSSDECDPCNYFGGTWTGVVCDSNNRVVALDLTNNNLTGTLYDIDLPKLETLILGRNEISGHILDFSKMPNLKKLHISENFLTGNIPDFSHLVKLEELVLWGNNFSGNLADFTNLKSLRSLYLGGNQLSGNIPDFKNFEDLEFLGLSRNQFTGNIPHFKNLPSLKKLYLNNNNLVGEIPNLIMDCPKLETFEAESNKLTGCYPEFLCSIVCRFQNNPMLPFSGDINAYCSDEVQIGASCGGRDLLYAGIIQQDCSCYIEPCVSSYPEFQDLLNFYEQAGGENWINNTGWKQAALGVSCDPCETLAYGIGKWYGILCDLSGRVAVIDMDGSTDGLLSNFEGNNLVGTVPELRFPYLRHLILTGNNLTGPLPDVGSYPELKSFGIAGNQFEGEMPHFSNNSNLEIFRGSFNRLTGSLPDFSAIPKLSTFTASDNFLNGCFNANVCNIELFHVENNNAMPWRGDHTKYCEGISEVGAPCLIMETNAQGHINDDCTCIENMISGVEDNKFSISISPNPVRNQLKIESEFVKERMSYEIMDMAGVVVQSGFLLHSSINVGVLNSGVYILRMKHQHENPYFIDRFIKL